MTVTILGHFNDGPSAAPAFMNKSQPMPQPQQHHQQQQRQQQQPQQQQQVQVDILQSQYDIISSCSCHSCFYLV